MNKREFDSLLQKKMPQAMLFYGEDNFYIDFYTKKCLQKCREHQIVTFYFTDYNFNNVVDFLGQGSLFGDGNVVVLKLEHKLPKKEIESFFQCLKNNLNNFLIINFFRSESKSMMQYAQDFKSFASNFKADIAVDVRFFTPTFQEGFNLLKQRARELDIDIQDFLLQNLLQIQNNNLAIALSELEKYQIFNSPITNEQIQQLSYGLGSISMNDFLESLFEKKNYLQVYEKMIEEGGDSMSILQELERYFYILFSFCAYIKVYGRCNAKEILGYQPPSFIVEQYTKRAIKLKEKQFQNIFKIFGLWRNGQMEGKKEIDLSALIKIKAIL